MTLIIIIGLIVSGIVAILFVLTQQTKHLSSIISSNSRATLDAIDTNRKLVDTLGYSQTPLKSIEPSKIEVLIVEDDPVNLRLTSTILKTAGYKVQTSANAETALKIVSESGVPDLIVLDILLGQMDGFEFARQIRLTGSQVPIIAHSGSIGTSAAERYAGRTRALDSGCNAMVPKSGDGSELLLAIAQWLMIAASVKIRNT